MTSARKLILGVVVCSVLTLTLFELSLPLLNDRYSGNFKGTITASTLKADEGRRFFFSRSFDPDLGWDYQPIARDHVAKKTDIAQSYGDSFTYGGQEETRGTWQAHFDRLTGKGIINLGVGGYGLDQAVLKFKKYGRRYSTRIAILGLYHDMFRRALSYHSFYYFNNSVHFTFVFKPIFIKKDSQFELLPPPCTDIACVTELLSNPNHHVWQFLKQYDYWYKKKSGSAGFRLSKYD